MKAEAVQALMPRIYDSARKEIVDRAAPSELEVETSFYRDEERWQWEKQHLFEQGILVAAPGCQIPEPGDFVVKSMMGRSVLVSRDAAGEVHVLLNYCRHRGAQVECEHHGNKARFACPYHGWTYNSRGDLVGVPHKQGFKEMDNASRGLPALPSEERHGLIFFSFNTELQLDLDAFLGELDAELALWDLDKCHYLEERSITTEANWKTGIEAFGEFYHFPFGHKDSIGPSCVKYATIYDQFSQHHRIISPLVFLMELSEEQALQHQSQDNFAVVYWLFPNTVIISSPAGVEYIQVFPGDHPEQAVMSHLYMAKNKPQNEDEMAMVQGTYDFSNQVFFEEDVSLVNSCGLGVKHSQMTSFIIGRNEPGVQNMIRQLSKGYDAQSGTE